MVIRFTKTTKFFLVCALLLVTALISIGTKSMSVSAPYSAPAALPLVIYRDIGEDSPTSLDIQGVRDDLDYLRKHFTALSEQEIVYTLRRKKALTLSPVLLIFDDTAETFGAEILPLLEERELPWFSVSKAKTLTDELRTAGFPVKQFERTGGISIEEQLGLH